MPVTLKRVTIGVFAVYCILTCYTAYVLLVKNSLKSKKTSQRVWSLPAEDEEEEWNPWGEEFEHEQHEQHALVQKPHVKWWSNRSLDFGKQFHRPKLDEVGQVESHSQNYNVEIWGKAAIGLYLWEHVFNGKLEKKMEGVWSYGFRKIDSIKFKFRTGPGVITTKAPADVENLILVLNGRSDEKVAFAKMWLDYLPQFKQLRNVGVVLLGNEQCQNNWLLPYMTHSGGHVNFTFVVYDSSLVDNLNFYQWPLGVATYRGFPKTDPKKLDLESTRPYTCNFLGTIYPQSSREQLLQIIEKHNLSQFCFVKIRQEWQPQETKETLDTYIQSLRLSDLTLSPVGMNTECYRIYEAMAFGSVPVVEDVMTPGECTGSQNDNISAPLKLLKAMSAPVIYIKDWSELPKLIHQEKLLSQKEKVQRRIKVVQWYENFKIHLREHLVSIVKERFFKIKR